MRNNRAGLMAFFVYILMSSYLPEYLAYKDLEADTSTTEDEIVLASNFAFYHMWVSISMIIAVAFGYLRNVFSNAEFLKIGSEPLEKVVRSINIAEGLVNLGVEIFGFSFFGLAINRKVSHLFFDTMLLEIFGVITGNIYVKSIFFGLGNSEAKISKIGYLLAYFMLNVFMGILFGKLGGVII